MGELDGDGEKAKPAGQAAAGGEDISNILKMYTKLSPGSSEKLGDEQKRAYPELNGSAAP